MTIRSATLADAEAIADLHVRSWQAVYRGQMSDTYLDGLTVEERLPNLRWSLENPPEDWRMWVAEEDGAIVGFASTGPSMDADAKPSDRIAELFAIYLEPSRVGTGLGRALFEHAVADLRARGFSVATLWVLETNDLARRFYERAGWTQDGATTTERIDCENLPTVRYRSSLRWRGACSTRGSHPSRCDS